MKSSLLQRHKETFAIRTIQRHYRGYFSRRKTYEFVKEQKRNKLWIKTLHIATTTIQKVFRGYIGRRIAISRRYEMIEFISKVFVEEGIRNEYNTKVQQRISTSKCARFSIFKKRVQASTSKGGD